LSWPVAVSRFAVADIGNVACSLGFDRWEIMREMIMPRAQK
jgi:ABC-type sulfate transport system permease component